MYEQTNIPDTRHRPKPKKKRWPLILALLLVLPILALSIWYGSTPLRFRLEKANQLKEEIGSFYTSTDDLREEVAEVTDGQLVMLYVKTQDGTVVELQEDCDDDGDLSIKFSYDEVWMNIRAYNTALYRDKQSKLTGEEAFLKAAFDLEECGFTSEIFAVLSIPKLNLTMPLYLGASYQHLSDGAAILSETSIPIGGKNTNCVISGHRGWNGYPYFLNIVKLEPGDMVYITNPWEVLTYTVVDTAIIQPTDINSILIQEGKDMLTLLTCHPPASGGLYRYLVYCERVETSESDPARSVF